MFRGPKASAPHNPQKNKSGKPSLNALGGTEISSAPPRFNKYAGWAEWEQIGSKSCGSDTENPIPFDEEMQNTF